MTDLGEKMVAIGEAASRVLGQQDQLEAAVREGLRHVFAFLVLKPHQREAITKIIAEMMVENIKANRDAMASKAGRGDAA